MKIIEFFFFTFMEGMESKGKYILSFYLENDRMGMSSWLIWMTKVVELYTAIAVDETGTVLLPFTHILVNIEQIPTSYKVLVLSLLYVKILYFVEAIPNNIPVSWKNQNQKMKFDSKYSCRRKTCWFFLV